MAYRYKSQATLAAEQATKVETFEKVKAAVALVADQWTINERLYTSGFSLGLTGIATFDCKIFAKVVRVYASKYTQVSHLSTNFKKDASVDEIAKELKTFGDTVKADRARAKAKADAKDNAIEERVARLQKVIPTLEKTDNGFYFHSGIYRKVAGNFSYNQTVVQSMTLYDLTIEQTEKILAVLNES
jgi:hypothetical protein